MGHFQKFRQCFDGSSPQFANGVGGAAQSLGDLHERQPIGGMPHNHLPIMFRQHRQGTFQPLVAFARWHLYSLGVNMLTVLLVTGAMTQAAFLPAEDKSDG